MEYKNPNLSIRHIKSRIKRLESIKKDFELKIISKEYFYESIKLNLIEIGEESKVLNDIIKQERGKWEDIISKEYNFRISLTHHYKNMFESKIDKHIKNDFPKFIKKIEEIEKELKEK